MLNQAPAATAPTHIGIRLDERSVCTAIRLTIATGRGKAGRADFAAFSPAGHRRFSRPSGSGQPGG
jgi:hypothetical protein